MELILYSTDGCHLCDDARELLASLQASLNFQVNIIDIASSEELVKEYGTAIPVLAFQNKNSELRWPFDAETFLSWYEML